MINGWNNSTHFIDLLKRGFQMEVWFGIDISENNPLLSHDAISLEEGIKEEFDSVDIAQDMLDFIQVLGSDDQPQTKEICIRTPEIQTIDALQEMKHCFNTLIDSQINLIREENN